MRGGGCTNFLSHFQEVNKGVYFFQNANNLNFKLFFRLYRIFSPWIPTTEKVILWHLLLLDLMTISSHGWYVFAPRKIELLKVLSQLNIGCKKVGIWQIQIRLNALMTCPKKNLDTIFDWFSWNNLFGKIYIIHVDKSFSLLTNLSGWGLIKAQPISESQ